MKRNIFYRLVLALMIIVFSINGVSAVLNNSIGGYSFDVTNVTGNTLLDLSNQGNDGKCYNFPDGNCQTTLGILNNATQFDSTDSYINVSGVNSYLTKNSDFAISCWINTNDATNLRYVLSSAIAANDRTTIAIQSGFLQANVYSGSWLTTNKAKIAINASTWHHVVFNYNVSGTQRAKVYLNTVGGAVGDNVGAANNDGFTMLGAASTLPVGFFYDGYMDECYFYNRTLNTQEISSMYNGGSAFNPYFVAPLANKTLTYNTININNQSITPVRYLQDTTPTFFTNITNTTTNGNVNNTIKIYNSTPALIITNQYANNSRTGTFTPTSALPDGIYNADFFGVNNETNVTSGNKTFYIDNVPPNIQQLANVSSGVFSINFSTIFNVTDALSGLDTCLINITELENVTTPDNFLINCTDTQVFNSSGLHNAFVTATDNAGNSATYSYNFTIIPSVIINFKDSLGAYIYNYSVTIYHPDSRIETRNDTLGNITLSPVNNGTLDLGVHQLLFNKFGYILQNFSVNITETSANQTFTFNASDSVISIKIRDKSTGNIITGTNFSLEFIATVGLSTWTNTGVKNITNIFFLPETYILTVTNAGYQTERLIFDFTNQENLELNAYMILKNDSNLGYVKIFVVDRLTQPVEGAKIQALQWFPSTSSYTVVSEEVTGSDGVGNLNVILDDKTYKFRAIFEGEFSDSVPQTIATVDNGKTITIVLTATLQEKRYLFQNLVYSISESFNNVTNISTVTVDWTNKDGTAINMCINSYRSIGTVDTITGSNCVSSASSTLIQAYFINSSYTQKVKVEVKVGSNFYTLKTFKYNPSTSVPEVLKFFGWHVFLIPLMFIVSISLGILLENIFIGTILLMISSGVSLILAPSLITGAIVAFLFFMGFTTLWGGVKPK